MGSKYTKSSVYSGNVIQYKRRGGNSPLDGIRAELPEELVNCLKMCLSNAVTSDFFIATLDWAKRELEGCNATEAESLSQVAVKALRAQAFKGVGPEELEFMQIAAVDAIVDLNDAAAFPTCEELLGGIENPSPSGLRSGHEPEAAATVFVDALANAYWNPVLRLVDVLIEVVGKKKQQEYNESVRVWSGFVNEAKAELAEAEGKLRRARSAHSDLEDNVRKAQAELERAQSDDRLARQDEELLAEVKQAEVDLTKAELALVESQKERETCELTLSRLRQELAGLGFFAFDRKKTLKLEIEAAEGKAREIGQSIGSQEMEIRALKEKIEQRAEIERRLAAYPESRVPELEDKVRDAKREANEAYKQVKEAESAKSGSERRLQQRQAERPEESDYSPEAGKSRIDTLTRI